MGTMMDRDGKGFPERDSIEEQMEDAGITDLRPVSDEDYRWPGPVNTTGITSELLETEVLTTEQQQRRDALYAAATVLEKRGPMNSVVPAPVNELVKIANFILDGEAML
jgi:hypothetical protein